LDFLAMFYPPLDIMEPLPVGVWPSYFSALGRFFHAYARAETSMNSTISNFVDERIGPTQDVRDHVVITALLGGARLAGSRDTLKRLLRVTQAPDETHQEVHRIFLQLGEISFFRDRIAHNGASPTNFFEPGTWYSIDNFSNSREFEQLETLYFTPEMLMDMAYDLFRIPSMLSFALSERARAFTLRQADAPEVSPTRKGAREHLAQLREPWRYKPSQLKRTGPKHDHRSQWSDLPPTPSQG
jgi:hypothetical protein